MKIVTRYVLGELLLVFGLTLAAMTVFMILLGVALEAAKQGLGPEPILRLVPYVMPNALRFAVPAAILFAACAVYGRMAAANEIIAVKTMGVSPMAIFWPGFTLAFAVSLAAVWLNDLAASWGREGIQRVVLESVEQIVYGTLRTHRSYRASDRLAITVRRVDGRRLIQPTITTQDAEGRTTTITASEAELRGRPEANSLTLRLWDSVIETGGRGKLTWPGMFEHDIPLRDATKGGEGIIRMEHRRAAATHVADSSDMSCAGVETFALRHHVPDALLWVSTVRQNLQEPERVVQLVASC